MSLDINEMIRAVKRAAIDAVNAQKPCNMFYGIVSKSDPLEIVVEQKMTLTVAQLVLSRNVTRHEIEVEFTPEEGLKGKKKLTLHDELKTGEKVLLLRCAGGQSFVVIDRVGGG